MCLSFFLQGADFLNTGMFVSRHGAIRSQYYKLCGGALQSLTDCLAAIFIYKVPNVNYTRYCAIISGMLFAQR